jgi:hypothetical protein
LVARHCDAFERGHGVVLKALMQAFYNTPRLNGAVQSTSSTKYIYSPGNKRFAYDIRILTPSVATNIFKQHTTPYKKSVQFHQTQPRFLLSNDYIFQSKIPSSWHRYKICNIRYDTVQIVLVMWNPICL